MDLKAWLMGSRTIEGTPSVQPNGATVATLNHEIKHRAQEAFLGNAGKDIWMQVGVVGWSEPNPTFLNGIPVNGPITGTPDIRTTDAPTRKGGCN